MIHYSREKTEEEKPQKKLYLHKIKDFLDYRAREWFICSYCKVIFQTDDEVLYDVKKNRELCPLKTKWLKKDCRRSLTSACPEYFEENYKLVN